MKNIHSLKNDFIFQLHFKQLATERLIDHERLMHNGEIGEILDILITHGIVDAKQWQELIDEVDSQIDLLSRHPAEEGNSQAVVRTTYNVVYIFSTF